MCACGCWECWPYARFLFLWNADFDVSRSTDSWRKHDFALHREKSLCRCEYFRLLRFKCIIKWDAPFNVISSMKHGATQHWKAVCTLWSPSTHDTFVNVSEQLINFEGRRLLYVLCSTKGCRAPFFLFYELVVCVPYLTNAQIFLLFFAT